MSCTGICCVFLFFVVALLFCCMMGHQDFKGTLRFVMFDGSDFICQWTILSTTLNIDRNWNSKGKISQFQCFQIFSFIYLLINYLQNFVCSHHDQTKKILPVFALITIMRIIIENNENYKQIQIKSSGCITVMRIWNWNVLNYEHNVTMQKILMVL